MKLSFILGTSLGLFFALIGLYIVFQTKLNNSPSKPYLNVNTSHPIETYIEQGKCLRFDRSGLKIEQLYLDSAYHLKGESVSHLINPRLIQSKHGKYLELSAQRAQAIHLGLKYKIQKIIFNDDVKLNNTTFKLHTTELTYHPDLNLAKTNKLIDIFGTNLHIQSKGMALYLNSGKITLLNQVKSTYDYNKI